MKDKKIKQAYEFAKKAHEGQKQVSGRPYFDHPKKVAELLTKWNQDPEVICAGLLHDVVEDCDIPIEEIKNKFDERVANLVDAMSFVLKNENGKSKKDMDATYKKFIKHVKNEPSLALIKSADMLSNIPNIHILSHRDFIINKSWPRLKMFWLPFIREVGLGDIASKIEKEFSDYTTEDVQSVLEDYISKKDLEKIRDKVSDFKIKEKL